MEGTNKSLKGLIMSLNFFEEGFRLFESKFIRIIFFEENWKEGKKNKKEEGKDERSKKKKLRG